MQLFVWIFLARVRIAFHEAADKNPERHRQFHGEENVLLVAPEVIKDISDQYEHEAEGQLFVLVLHQKFTRLLDKNAGCIFLDN